LSVALDSDAPTSLADVALAEAGLSGMDSDLVGDIDADVASDGADFGLGGDATVPDEEPEPPSARRRARRGNSRRRTRP
jgi:hypothetical protein